MKSRRNFKGFVTLMLVFFFITSSIPKVTHADEDNIRNKIGKIFKLTDTEEFSNITGYDFILEIIRKAQNGKPGEVSIQGIISLESSQRKIELPKYVTNIKTKCSYYVTEISNQAFAQSEISELVFHDGITKIGQKAFMGSKIETIKIPKSVKAIETSAISYCYYLKEIIVEDGNPYYSSKDNAFLTSKNGKTLIATINNGDVLTIPYGIQKIDECALSSNIFLDEGTSNSYTRLKKLTIPSTVTEIYPHNINSSIIVFKGKNLPKIYDNELDVDLIIVLKENLNKLKNMKYDGKEIFCDNVLVKTKVPYQATNQKFLNSLDPNDYLKNPVKYKDITKFTKAFLKKLKENNPDITDRDIVFEVFNYIRENYELDSWYMHEEFKNKSSRTSEFLFQNKVGYINSFTALGQYMLREIGIPCATVSYTTNRNTDIHDTEITSAVYIEGKWILVDFCLDKPYYFDYLDNFSIKTKLTRTYTLK